MRSNGVPCEAPPCGPHVSVSVKSAALPALTNIIETPLRLVPAVLVSVIGSVVGGEPMDRAGNVRADGASEMGCWQAVVLFTPRQTFPVSAGLCRVPPPQAAAKMAYPAPAKDSRAYPFCV